MNQQDTFKTFTLVVQNGYENLTAFENRTVLPAVDSNGEYGLPDITEPQEDTTITDTVINKFKTQYKSGYQVQGTVSTMTGREKLELKDTQRPYLIRPEKYLGANAYQFSGGHSGYQKVKLVDAANGNTINVSF